MSADREQVLVLTFGDERCASTIFRIRQYGEPLRRAGIDLELFPANTFADWARVRQYDAVIVQKRLFSLGRVRWLRREARRLLYDVDDAIWHPRGRPHHPLTRLRTQLRVRAIARAAELCTAANDVLGERLRRLGGRVRVVPMGLDEAAWPLRPKTPGKTVRIGWSGAPGNLSYLEALEPVLVAVQRRFPQVEYVVLCGKAPAFSPALRWVHVPWRPGIEAEVVGTFDVGLLPLPDDPFAQGKSPIKGLQYLASGVASVATPLAATRELFGGGDVALFAGDAPAWGAALQRLAGDPQLRTSLGESARRLFEERYTLAAGLAAWRSVLRGG